MIQEKNKFYELVLIFQQFYCLKKWLCLFDISWFFSPLVLVSSYKELKDQTRIAQAGKILFSCTLWNVWADQLLQQWSCPAFDFLFKSFVSSSGHLGPDCLYPMQIRHEPRPIREGVRTHFPARSLHSGPWFSRHFFWPTFWVLPFPYSDCLTRVFQSEWNNLFPSAVARGFAPGTLKMCYRRAFHLCEIKHI